MENRPLRGNSESRSLHSNNSDRISEISAQHENHDAQQHDALKAQALDQTASNYVRRISSDGKVHNPELHEKLRRELLQQLGHAPDATSVRNFYLDDHTIKWNGGPSPSITPTLDRTIDHWIQSRIKSAEGVQTQAALIQHFRETGSLIEMENLGILTQIKEHTQQALKEQQKAGDQLFQHVSSERGEIERLKSWVSKRSSELREAEERLKNQQQKIQEIQGKLQSKEGRLQKFREGLIPGEKKRRIYLEYDQEILQRAIERTHGEVDRKRAGLRALAGQHKQASQELRGKMNTVTQEISGKTNWFTNKRLLSDAKGKSEAAKGNTNE